MSLQEQFTSDLKSAMLGGDKLTTQVLRMLKSAITYADTQEGVELTESDILKLVRKEVKKRHEAAESFRKAQSEDRAIQEEAEAAILEKYLPAQIDPAQVETFVKELKDSSPDLNRGDAIRRTLSEFDGQTDGKTVAEIVSKIFS